jgi:hypothetical protein
MDYSALAKKFGAIERPSSTNAQQTPDWAQSLSPKDQAELNMKLYQEGRKRLSDLDTEINKAQPVLDDLSKFGELNRNSRTGGVLEQILPSSPLLHGADENQMMAIQSRIAPAQRPTGSGSSSDTDVRLFLGGLPSIAQTGPVNKNIREDFQRKFDYAINKRNAMQQHLNKYGNLNSFDEAWNASIAPKSAPSGKSKMATPKFLGFED